MTEAIVKDEDPSGEGSRAACRTRTPGHAYCRRAIATEVGREFVRSGVVAFLLAGSVLLADGRPADRSGHPSADRCSTDTCYRDGTAPLLVRALGVKRPFGEVTPVGWGWVVRGRVVWSGSCARGRPALLRSATSGWLRGRRQDVRWGDDPAGEKLCGRSVFLGRARVRVGRALSGAGRGASV